MKRLISGALLACLMGYAQTKAPDVGSATPIWEPPAIDWPQSTATGSVIHKFSLGEFQITLDRTPLREAQERFGGTLGARGDAGEAEQWLCFRSSDAGGSWVLWLTSDELNGDNVGAPFGERLDPGRLIDPRCRLLRDQNLVKLQIPVELGMGAVEARRLLGRPSVVQSDELFYLRDRQQISNAIRYTISNGLEIRLCKGVVCRIAAFEYSQN